MSEYDRAWAAVDVRKVPHISVKPPGPKSRALAKRAGKYMQGYSSQAHLFPVAFESGKGVILTDVDGNKYIDFSSGIYTGIYGDPTVATKETGRLLVEGIVRNYVKLIDEYMKLG